MLERDGTKLRPLELEDLDALYQWHQDAEIEAYSGWTPRLSRARFDRRYEELVRDPPEDMVLFAIENRGQLVGYVELSEISRWARRASIGFVVAEPTARRQGVGTRAVILMLDYGFSLEDLERIYAEVYTFNEPSRRLLARVGFVHEGTLRRHEIHQGRRQDVAVYGLLRQEFYARYPTTFPVVGG